MWTTWLRKYSERQKEKSRSLQDFSSLKFDNDVTENDCQSFVMDKFKENKVNLPSC